LLIDFLLRKDPFGYTGDSSYLFIQILFIPGYHRFTDGKAADILRWPWNV